MKKHDKYGTEQEDDSNMPRHSVQILGNLASCEVHASPESPRKLTRCHTNHKANTGERDKGHDH
jgi:hypothetical protein